MPAWPEPVTVAAQQMTWPARGALSEPWISQLEDGELIDDDPVVLLSAEHVCVAVAVLVEAVARPEVELHGSRRDLGRCTGRCRVAGGRDGRLHAVVLVGDVTTRVW